MKLSSGEGRSLGDVAVHVAKVLVQDVDVGVELGNSLTAAVFLDGKYGQGQNDQATDGEGEPQEVQRQ